jgi:alkyldihydroxyacetonephosphate synthase
MAKTSLRERLTAAVLGTGKRRNEAAAPPHVPSGVGPDQGDTRFVPPAPPPLLDDVENPEGWGFRDSRFVVRPDGSVLLTGSRYNISNVELPSLLPWVSEQLGARLSPTDVVPSRFPPAVPPARPMPDFVAELARFLAPDQWTDDPLVRLRHGHGHTQEEIHAIRYGGKVGRVPDLVVFPSEEAHVDALVAAAMRRDVVLIPYGGGTNVTDALRCPEDEPRPIVSVDMRRLRRILWIDPVNRMARIEAGASGRDLLAGLAQYGLTMGHEPDSVEFSTLGGWIATNASGMKKNRYGNIEDLVLDMRVVTAAGVVERTSVAPRESIGTDPRVWMLGSEGNFGIVTSAVVKLFPLPEETRYGSVIFPDFEHGFAFLYDVTRSGAVPASLRLMDNVQFQFGQALKPAARGLAAKKSQLEKLIVTKVKGFDPRRLVAATLVFEGTREEVEAQEASVYRIARRHGGLEAGAENGKRGYELTYGIAYIRDLVFEHHMVAESFETSVPWSRAIELCDRVKMRMAREHERRRLPGKPFVTCRVTQVYETGVCVYFYLAFYLKGVPDPTRVYLELEKIARDEILACGGSLSHHHGVGKLRRPFLERILSPAALAWRARAKAALDPTNVFGAANHGVAPEPRAPHSANGANGANGARGAHGTRPGDRAGIDS